MLETCGPEKCIFSIKAVTRGGNTSIRVRIFFACTSPLREINRNWCWDRLAILKLRESGFDVHAADLGHSNYKKDRIFPVPDYDGHHIPFADSTFDIVFSSNVMEHIPHVSDF